MQASSWCASLIDAYSSVLMVEIHLFASATPGDSALGSSHRRSTESPGEFLLTRVAGQELVLVRGGRERIEASSRSYWFNDMDYHGVEPDPVFRYSIRVGGAFERQFVKQLEQSRRR